MTGKTQRQTNTNSKYSRRPTQWQSLTARRRHISGNCLEVNVEVKQPTTSRTPFQNMLARLLSLWLREIPLMNFRCVSFNNSKPLILVRSLYFVNVQLHLGFAKFRFKSAPCSRQHLLNLAWEGIEFWPEVDSQVSTLVAIKGISAAQISQPLNVNCCTWSTNHQLLLKQPSWSQNEGDF